MNNLRLKLLQQVLTTKWTKKTETIKSFVIFASFVVKILKGVILDSLRGTWPSGEVVVDRRGDLSLINLQ